MIAMYILNHINLDSTLKRGENEYEGNIDRYVIWTVKYRRSEINQKDRKMKIGRDIDIYIYESQ